MTKPIIARANTLEQWRTHTNRVSNNLGDPDLLYVSDNANNTSAVYSNGNDLYEHPVDQINAVHLAINDLNTRKIKRSGDTITGHLNILQNFGVNGNVTIGTNNANTITINSLNVSIPNNLNFDANTLYLDSTGNKVGIGQVPSSTETLQVTGNSKLIGTLQVTSTSQLDDDLTIGTSKFVVDAQTGNTTVKGAYTQDGTGNMSVTSTGTVTLSPTSTTTLGTLTQTTTLLGNVSAISSNQTVTISPTGTGTITINPATTGTINNVSVGATTRSTGAFTTLAANNSVTFTLATDNTLGTTASGAVQISGGVGIALNATVGGDLRVKGGDLTIEGTPNIQAVTVGSAVGLFDTTTGTVTLGAATSTLTAQSQIINMATAGASKYVSILADDAAAGTTGSGALRVAGGVGIAKTLYVGGNVSFTGSASTTINQTGNVSVTSTGNVSLTNTGNITISPTTSGQVVVSSITTGTINNMSIGATTRSTGAFTTLTSNAATTMTLGTDATSTTAGGTVTITGGAAVSMKLYAGSMYSDSLTSASSNTDLTLTGAGTGVVRVSDDLKVTGSVTVDTGDIVLSSGGDVVQTITSGVAASTANVFASSNTATLNIGDNADVNIGNVSKTTTVRGASTLTGAVSCSNNLTVTGTTDLNGVVTIDGANVNTTIAPTGTGTVSINPATAGNINNMNVGATTRGSGAFTTVAANGQITSTVTTGTAPLVIASTSVVSNLNVDMVDGKHVGTTGNVIPLLDGVNTWSVAQTFRATDAIRVEAASTQDAVVLAGRAGGTSSYAVSLTPTTLTGNRVLTLPNISGTVITSGDTGTVTNTMLAGSISNDKLVNNTVTVGSTSISLGSTATTLAGLTNVTSSQLTSTIASGTAPFVVASNTKVTNLNADLLDGYDWAAPPAIGSTTPAAGSFTTVSSSGGITGTLQTAAQTNITSVGTLSSLAISGDTTFNTNTVVRSASATTTTTSSTVVASFAAATFRSCEFIIQGVDSTNNRYTMSKILVIHNGSSSDYVEYGRIDIGGATFSALLTDYNSGNVELKVTPSSTSSTSWKVTMILTKV